MAETREDAPRKTFLLQGPTERTHLVALRTLLAQTTPDRVLLSVAYVTQGGDDLIASAVSVAVCRVDAFVGIRNGVHPSTQPAFPEDATSRTPTRKTVPRVRRPGRPRVPPRGHQIADHPDRRRMYCRDLGENGVELIALTLGHPHWRARELGLSSVLDGGVQPSRVN